MKAPVEAVAQVSEALRRKKVRTEHEIKLVADHVPAPELFDEELAKSGPTSGPEMHHQSSTYVDTERQELAAAGALLKVVARSDRTDARAWLMFKETIDRTDLIRHTLEVATLVRIDEVPQILGSQTALPVARACWFLRRSEIQLKQILVVRQARRKSWVHLKDGHSLEMSIDFVQYEDDRAAGQHIIEFEADADGDCLAELHEIAQRFLRRFDLEPELASKYERGLELRRRGG